MTLISVVSSCCLEFTLFLVSNDDVVCGVQRADDCSAVCRTCDLDKDSL
jgi:hypothetical protein